jgi:Ca-activated chloride channel family protein
MTTFTFANPEWLWCLLLLPLLLLLRARSHWRARRGVAGLVSPKLTKDLIQGARQWSRWIVFCLNLCALSLILAALARPQWGHEEVDEESESRNVAIAIDTSRSMLANDLQPDRLTRAKLAAQDIVAALPDDRIALIAFAGKAFVQAPLTLDHDAVLESIEQFDSELIPRGGSNLTDAANLAIESFEKVESRESALILFSDGEALEGRDRLESIAEKAKAVGLTVVAIGVGTENGSIIPEPDEKGRPQPGVFIKDDDGGVVRSRLDPESLRELSRGLGGGVYLDLATTRSPAQAVTEALQRIKATTGATQARGRPIDRYRWPLSAALVLLIAAWLLPGTTRLLERLFRAAVAAPKPAALPEKRPVPAAVAIFLVFALHPALKADIGEVDSPAYQAYLREQYDEAVKAYRTEIEAAEPGKQRAWLNLGLGAAAYKTGDLALAKEAFGRTLAEGDAKLNERAHYNLANALFRDGQAKLEASAHPKNPAIPKDDAAKQAIANQWQSAMEHYRAALALDSADPNARHNLSVVEKRIELLNQPPPPPEEPPPPPPQQQQQQQQQNQQQPQNQQQQNQPQPQNQPPQPQDQAPPKPEPSDQSDPSDQPPPQGQPEKSKSPPPPPSEPPPSDPEGKLESKPDTGKPKDEQPQQPAPNEVNPDTGFSPEEARLRLRTLSDEDKDVRPPVKLPFQAEKYKNW